jgi:tripartite-type tricarboxylate transporter receptor subunit TctC
VADTVPGFTAELWYALFAPAHTPSEIINRLGREIGTILTQGDIKAKLADQGVDAQTTTPQELAKQIALELEKWGKVVKVTGAKIN